VNLFQKIGNTIYGINGTSFGTTLNNCQVVDYLYQLGFKDNEQIKLDIEQYTGVFVLKDQSLVKYFPSHLSIFNPVSSPTFGGGITFWANGNQVVSHRGAGKFQLSSNRGATWSNLPDANVAGVAGNISSSLKNNYNNGRLVGTSNLNSWAYYSNPSWFYGNMPGNAYWNAVTLAPTGPTQTLAVGYDVAAILGVGGFLSRSIPLGDWRAVMGGLGWDNWIALDTAGRITKTTIPATTWSSPEQLFTAGGYYNPDLALIEGTQGTRYIAVGYNAANPSAELYISTLVPNDQAPSYNIINLSWKKINIPNGRWFKIANTSSSERERKTDVIYITEDPDNNQSQNRALVSWDCGENWGVVQLPTENGAKGSIMYLEKTLTPGYMRWFVSNGLNHAGYVIPPKLYSGVSLI